ncbi:nucleolar protein 12 [Angomonas deanei]|nr:nucleolar protein 12 [Angomonas deanei]|eukprot:EPY30449.1 nucleolar protein 12 [Angomonas deanei]
MADSVPTFNFEPVKKTTVDLFAPAPQVRKLSRREKRKLTLEAEVKNAMRQKKGATDEESKNADDEVFKTIFDSSLEDLTETEKRKKGGVKKSKKQILRHALHKNEEEDKRTAFVGNLPNTVDKREVEKIFKECGTIESVRVRCQTLEERKEGEKDVGRAVRVLRKEVKKDDEKYSAVAYVLFKEAKGVEEAIKKSGLIFKHRHIFVTSLKPEEAAFMPKTSIFLGNIAYDTTEEQVYQYFIQQGITDVKRVRLVKDRDTGSCKGFGYVEFQKPSSVQPAIDTRGNTLNGRPVRIVHVNKPKSLSAAKPSRREQRKSNDVEVKPKRRRDPSADKAQKKAKPEGTENFSWMGMTTNPRKKMPRDLRPLLDGSKPVRKGTSPACQEEDA